MQNVSLRDGADWMPDRLRPLESEATKAGIRNVSVLIERWIDGSERYDRSGESLLVAIDSTSQVVVGVGGLSRCPDVAGALRVRRFYVAERCRRRGVASALATELVVRGHQEVAVLTCNAGASSAAGPFWEAMGFEPTATDGITHQLLGRSRRGAE